MQRVTSNMFPDTLVNQFARLNQRQLELQRQAVTGLRVENPADDPAAMRRILQLQAEARTVAQYQTNIARLKERTTAGYNAFQSVQKILARAGEIATLAGGGRSPAELRIYAAEVSQLIRQAAQTLNAQSQGDYLFGGTRTDQPPFVLTEDANGRITSVTYQGNSTIPAHEIAEGVTVQILPANGTTDTVTGADLFTHLIELQDRLDAGDVAAIQANSLPALNTDEEHITGQVATLGALFRHMETAAGLATRRADSLDQLISAQADADLAEVITRLNQTQTAYQAALQSGARLLNLSLLDYLR